MIQFKGFKPEAEERLARTMGYSGEMEGFANYLAQNPAKQDQMNQYKDMAIGMLKGGMVPKKKPAFTDGGTPKKVQDEVATRAYTPALPTGAKVTASGTEVVDAQLIGAAQGDVSGDITAGTTASTVAQAAGVDTTQAGTVDPTQVTQDMRAQMAGVAGAQGQMSTGATVGAQTAQGTSVSSLNSAQGTGILMNNPAQRSIQAGELVSGAANAATAAKFTEQIQAAQATPTKQATVQGQLDGLMQDFEGGKTPSWAAGAMRAATSAMAARGLGASSLAGQAVVQAAMESALPIAQSDAATQAAFEAQNLSNRQERAMLAAQQRAAFIGMEFDQAFQSRVLNASKIADVANMNFTAEQQVALENSRIANTMELQNLNNTQALVMAEAAALSQMDMANLSNRQQAAVMNAQNFMAMDMKNLDNAQQATMFKAQAMQQALFTDQAAENAAKQFNATSQMQVDQFFANLSTQTKQFNASQSNAQSQFNAGESNAQSRFNSEMKNQREQFNAKNRLVIDQNNVQWRREVATASTAAINRANELNAKSIMDMSDTHMNNLWQYYSDSMEFAWQSAENERDRGNKLAQVKLQGDIKADIADLQNDYNSSLAFGNLIGTFLTAGLADVAGFDDFFAFPDGS
tara:strand:+ start:139 stop:2037 length:1899 start_codon:yes stop_codon:yes gene_type:complete